MNISRLEPKHGKEAFRLITCARLDLLQRNIDQWDESYPTEDLIRDDIEKGNAFGLFEGGKLIGYLVADETCVPEYESVAWKYRCDRVLMLHRLCVSPAYHHRGFAKALLGHAETLAAERGYGAIRLDAFTKNKITQYLVEGYGYECTGTIELRKGTFLSYEKRVFPRTGTIPAQEKAPADVSAEASVMR